MKTPTWQLSTLPRWPHHWRFTPTECVPRLGKLLGSKAMMPSGSPNRSATCPTNTVDQRAMIPGRGADEVLDDLSLDIDEGRDVLGILAGQVGQQPLEVEVHVALAGLGLQRVLIGHDELAQTVHHLR